MLNGERLLLHAIKAEAVRLFAEEQAPAGLIEGLVNILHDGCGCECCLKIEKDVKKLIKKLE